MLKPFNVMKEAWDCLIILGACRYDYFEKHYHQFFQGRLNEIFSVGTSTPDWLAWLA